MNYFFKSHSSHCSNNWTHIGFSLNVLPFQNMAQKTEEQSTYVKSKTVDLKTDKWFRCLSCNSEIYPVAKRGFYDENVSALSLHSDCKIEFLNEEQYQKASDLEKYKRNPKKYNEKQEVTGKRHTYLHKQQFLKKARILCKIEGDFCRYDFDEMSKVAFRKQVSRLKEKGLVFKIVGGREPLYTVKGEQRWVGKGNVTLEGMGVGKEFEKILRDAKIRYPEIHKIQIFFPSSDLHRILQKANRETNPHNKLIKITQKHRLNDHVRANVSVYPDLVEVDLSCTSIPIVYDTQGALELISILQKLRDELVFQTLLKAKDVPDCCTWMIKQYHFNKDSHKTYSGEKFEVKDSHNKTYSSKKFEVKVSEMSAGFIRFYSKKFPDGAIRVRLEQSRNPNNSVVDEAVKMIRTDNYVFGRVGSKLSDAEADEILYIRPKKRPQGGRQTCILNYIDFDN